MTYEKVLVDLTILNIAPEVSDDDEKATKLMKVVQQGELFQDARNAKTFLHSMVSNPTDNIQHIQEQILRYIKPSDKYAAFTSTLLKSRGFYRVMDKLRPKHHSPSSCTKERRVVVSLPRTKYQKPYIPLSQTSKNTIICSKEDVFPLSISHQYPFVGMTQFRKFDINDNPEQQQQHLPLLVGLDIVVFEDYNPRMYSNRNEFLDVFHDSFTSREWAIIFQQEDEYKDHRLQEFYIRWSMKEAYTKALGLGLGIDYSTLDIVLHLDDDNQNDGYSTGIFTSLEDHGVTAYQSGLVKYLEDEEKPDELWNFAFLLLNDGHVQGCACVCVGPSQENVSSPTLRSFELHVDWISLQSLIQWHEQETE